MFSVITRRSQPCLLEIVYIQAICNVLKATYADMLLHIHIQHYETVFGFVQALTAPC